MTHKKTCPRVGKLITSGDRSGFLEVGTSPGTPLEFKVLSPRGIINSDMGGVGLGIVAALSDNIPAKKTAFTGRNLGGSDPIPVNQARNVGLEMEDEAGSLEEEYTIVTCHKPNKSYTKVYHRGCVYETKKGIEIRHKTGVSNISPASCGDDMKVTTASDYLSSCHLCNKGLHGRDIYMYRGEKAFCSPECRWRQIGMDERRDKYCSSEASVDISTSPCNGTNTGIFAI